MISQSEQVDGIEQATARHLDVVGAVVSRTLMPPMRMGVSPISSTSMSMLSSSPMGTCAKLPEACGWFQADAIEPCMGKSKRQETSQRKNLMHAAKPRGRAAYAVVQRRAWLQTSMRAGLACAMTSFTIVLLACGHSVFSRWLNHVSCAEAHHGSRRCPAIKSLTQLSGNLRCAKFRHPSCFSGVVLRTKQEVTGAPADSQASSPTRR